MDNPEKLAAHGTHDTRQRKQKHNTIYVWPQYVQVNINKVNKTWAPLQSTGGKDELIIVYMWNL